MWAAIIVLVLVCGYLYVDTHLPSKYKLNKAVGWNAYFHVAVKGGEFLLQGAILALAVIIIVYTLMFVLNIPTYITGWYTPFSFADSITQYRISGMSFWSVSWLIFTILVSVGHASNARRDSVDLHKRIQSFREIAKDNSIEGILLETLDKVEDNLLLLVTLKSRKVYVGMIDIARFEGMDTSSLVLIPFMSGYRDKDTLSFKMEHDYTQHYIDEGITFTSEPLSVFQFRHVLPYEQIESFSLFNVNTYKKFQEVANEKEIKKESN
ncbi:TPA: hypothetical protein U2I32_003646 [Providencia rettgeri]|nr:hypothetical protein [Providencia rettgeri]